MSRSKSVSSGSYYLHDKESTYVGSVPVIADVWAARGSRR
jgi:hypothetical protein